MRSEVSIAEVADIILGGTPRTTVKEYWNGDIKWISVKDISSCRGKYLYSTEKSISRAGLQNSAAKLIGKDAIIISARGTVGRLCMTPYPMSFNQSCYGLVARPQRVDPHYLYYNLHLVLNQLHALSYGTTFSTITKATFEDVRIGLPSLPEQQKIVSILSAFDDKIELNNEMNKALEELAQAIFKHWFIDFEFPNEGGEPYKSSGGEFVDSELGPIPKGWKVVTLQDVCSRIASGGTPSRKVPEYFNGCNIWIRTKELRDGFIINSEEKISDSALLNSSAKLFPPETVVMAIYASPTVGRLGVLSTEAAFNQAACGMIVNDDVIPYEYLYLYLLSRRQFLNNMAVGSAQQNLSVQLVKELKILKPLQRLVLEFRQRVEPLFDRLLSNQKENAILSQLRDTLLPKLISGEIRVV